MNAFPIISFGFEADLVALRRTVAPRAYWMADGRAWRMTNGDAADFLAAATNALAALGRSAEITVDSETRRVGVPLPPVVEPEYCVPELRPARNPEERVAQNLEMIAWCREDCARRASAARS